MTLSLNLRWLNLLLQLFFNFMFWLSFPDIASAIQFLRIIVSITSSNILHDHAIVDTQKHTNYGEQRKFLHS